MKNSKNGNDREQKPSEEEKQTDWKKTPLTEKKKSDYQTEKTIPKKDL